MKYVVSVITILIVGLMLFAQSTNGKGPGPGFAGMAATLVAAVLFIIDLILIAFWIGTKM